MGGGRVCSWGLTLGKHSGPQPTIGRVPFHVVPFFFSSLRSFSWPSQAFRSPGPGPVLRHSLSELWSQGALQESVGLRPEQ